MDEAVPPPAERLLVLFPDRALDDLHAALRTARGDPDEAAVLLSDAPTAPFESVKSKLRRRGPHRGRRDREAAMPSPPAPAIMAAPASSRIPTPHTPHAALAPPRASARLGTPVVTIPVPARRIQRRSLDAPSSPGQHTRAAPPPGGPAATSRPTEPHTQEERDTWASHLRDSVQRHHPTQAILLPIPTGPIKLGLGPTEAHAVGCTDLDANSVDVHAGSAQGTFLSAEGITQVLPTEQTAAAAAGSEPEPSTLPTFSPCAEIGPTKDPSQAPATKKSDEGRTSEVDHPLLDRAPALGESVEAHAEAGLDAFLPSYLPSNEQVQDEIDVPPAIKEGSGSAEHEGSGLDQPYCAEAEVEEDQGTPATARKMGWSISMSTAPTSGSSSPGTSLDHLATTSAAVTIPAPAKRSGVVYRFGSLGSDSIVRTGFDSPSSASLVHEHQPYDSPDFHDSNDQHQRASTTPPKVLEPESGSAQTIDVKGESNREPEGVIKLERMAELAPASSLEQNLTPTRIGTQGLNKMEVSAQQGPDATPALSGTLAPVPVEVQVPVPGPVLALAPAHTPAFAHTELAGGHPSSHIPPPGAQVYYRTVPVVASPRMGPPASAMPLVHPTFNPAPPGTAAPCPGIAPYCPLPYGPPPPPFLSSGHIPYPAPVPVRMTDTNTSSPAFPPMQVNPHPALAPAGPDAMQASSGAAPGPQFVAQGIPPPMRGGYIVLPGPHDSHQHYPPPFPTGGGELYQTSPAPPVPGPTLHPPPGVATGVMPPPLPHALPAANWAMANPHSPPHGHGSNIAPGIVMVPSPRPVHVAAPPAPPAAARPPPSLPGPSTTVPAEGYPPFPVAPGMTSTAYSPMGQPIGPAGAPWSGHAT